MKSEEFTLRLSGFDRSASSAVSWLKEPREKILFQSEKYPRAKIFHISRDGGRATPFPRLRYFFPPPNSPLLFFVQLRPKRVTIFTLPPPPPLPVYNEYAEASFRFPTRKWYLASESSIDPGLLTVFVMDSICDFYIFFRFARVWFSVFRFVDKGEICERSTVYLSWSQLTDFIISNGRREW